MDENGVFKLETFHVQPIAPEQELDRVRRELNELRERFAHLQRDRDFLEDRLGEIQSSLSWLVMSRMSRLRS